MSRFTDYALRPTSDGRVALLVAQDDDVARLELTHHEAAGIGLDLLRSVPPYLARELVVQFIEEVFRADLEALATMALAARGGEVEAS